jgi:hypothetical protein
VGLEALLGKAAFVDWDGVLRLLLDVRLELAEPEE